MLKRTLQGLIGVFGFQFQKIRPYPHGESVFILDFALEVLNARRNGHVRFIQIGANDGIVEDPCYAWICNFDWQGVLVEPQPQLAAKLRELHSQRPQIRVLEAAIAKATGKLDLYFLNVAKGAPESASGIASLSLASLESHRYKFPNFDKLVDRVSVPTLPFSRVVELSGHADIDFIQIDAEGFDAQIIDSLDLNILRPMIISYEHCNLSFEENEACRRKLSKAGYHFATWHGDTMACLPELFPVSVDRKTYQLPKASV
jgi:FkbM family methyltransferase